MSSIVLTGTAGWQLAASGFANPMYISGPAGMADPNPSIGFDISSSEVILIAFDGTYTGQTLVHEQTADPTGANGWFAVSGVEADAPGTIGTGASTTATAYLFPCLGVRHRMRVTALATGTMIARVALTTQGVLTIAGGAGGGGTGALANQVQGNSATGATDVGNPVKIGGVFNTVPPVLTTGQRGDLQLTANSSLRTMAGILSNTASDTLSNNIAFFGRVDTSANSGPVAVAQFIFNGGSWDRAVKSNQTSRIPTIANTTNATSAKGSAGNIFVIIALNTTATITYLKIYNKATAPTVGTDTPIMTLPIPANGALTVDFAQGYYCSTGIAYGITTDAADGGSTAPAAGAIVGLNMMYS